MNRRTPKEWLDVAKFPKVLGVDLAEGEDVTVISTIPYTSTHTVLRSDINRMTEAAFEAVRKQMEENLKRQTEQTLEELFNGPPDFETMKNITPRKLLK